MQPQAFGQQAAVMNHKQTSAGPYGQERCLQNAAPQMADTTIRLPQRPFCDAKRPVLPCKTTDIVRQNGLRRNVLTARLLAWRPARRHCFYKKRQANEPTLTLKHGPAANSQQPTAPPGGLYATRGRCIARAENTAQPQRPKLLSNSIMVRTSRFSSTWLHGMLSSRACICSVTGRLMPAHSS